jgi:hypothetical protein
MEWQAWFKANPFEVGAWLSSHGIIAECLYYDLARSQILVKFQRKEDLMFAKLSFEIVKPQAYEHKDPPLFSAFKLGYIVLLIGVACYGIATIIYGIGY